MVGNHGQIAGVIFGHPLHAPVGEGRQNKILWVARDGNDTTGGDGNLLITAEAADSGQVVERTIRGGPGPSIIDMPAAGCWTFTLRWSGHTDTVDLSYRSA